MNNTTQRRRRVRKNRSHKAQISRILLTVCMMALVAVVSIGGTIAWLTDNTETIVNTFTTSDVTVTLSETATEDGDENALTNSYKMVPGMTVPKDPKVTVAEGSEPCYVFVKFEKGTTYDNYMAAYETTGSWTKLEDGVYYYNTVVNASADAQELQVLKNDQITVLSTVTKENMQAIVDGQAAAPTLSVTAYAIQEAGFTYGEGKDYDDLQTAMTAAWAAIIGN